MSRPSRDPTTQEWDEALSNPDVQDLITQVRVHLPWKWQLKILPRSKQPYHPQNMAGSYAEISDKSLWTYARIYVAYNGTRTVTEVVLHELHHVLQFFEGVDLRGEDNQFAEHDADQRIYILGYSNALESPLKSFSVQNDPYFKHCKPFQLVRAYLYGDARLRERVRRVAAQRQDSLMDAFLASRFAEHGRIEPWETTDLVEASNLWYEWTRQPA